jgi:hypothetical protein
MRALSRTLPRAALLGLTLLGLALIVPAGAAVAQVQQNDPNAANASFALQSQIRTLNQQRVTDFNTLNQTIQRNAHYDAFGPYLPYRGLHGGLHGGRHVGRALGRPGIVPGSLRRGGINSSVCIGC